MSDINPQFHMIAISVLGDRLKWDQEVRKRSHRMQEEHRKKVKRTALSQRQVH
jgi:hypothetical protein